MSSKWQELGRRLEADFYGIVNEELCRIAEGEERSDTRKPFIMINPERYMMRESLISYGSAVALLPIRSKLLYIPLDDAKRLIDDIQREIERKQ